MEIFDPSMQSGVSLQDFESAFGEISAVSSYHLLSSARVFLLMRFVWKVYEKDNEFVNMICSCFNVSEEPADTSRCGTAARAIGTTTRPFSMESRSQLAVERRREVLTHVGWTTMSVISTNSTG